MWFSSILYTIYIMYAMCTVLVCFVFFLNLLLFFVYKDPFILL